MVANTENKLARVGLVILGMWALFCFSGFAYVFFIKVIHVLNETKNLHRYIEIVNIIGIPVSLITAGIGLWSLFSAPKKEAVILLLLSSVVFLICFSLSASVVLA